MKKHIATAMYVVLDYASSQIGVAIASLVRYSFLSRKDITAAAFVLIATALQREGQL
jgi:hypothetical protein